ncbi:MAG TPA: Trp biosynthesis-associated membrane protein [Nocardioidaceae bacterium]|nr:Trp biosynthesis-associated membrane protein [Nocardioidaceae bacterium]
MPEKPAGARPRDRTFGPAVAAGLVGAALAAVAGSRDWASARADAAGIRVEASVTGAESQPLVPALALVALAAWGVVLVTRGRVRRGVSAVGLLASVGSLVGVVLGFGAAQEDAQEAAVARGATGDVFATSLSPWYYLAAAGALLAAAAFAVAVARSPRWPAMGTKYDAPSGRSTPPDDEDMWRALDEGRDPTS